MSRVVNCPTCGAPVVWEPASRWRPFCSERCKIIDLGDWAANRHVIPGRNDPAEDGTDEPGTTPAD
jgi:endogenous inhibitor of DNA gyrase (YacG/DUF329 family)